MFIEIIKAIVLGIVEGLTEFLPISSTGHLIIFNQWLNFSEPFTQMFDIVIQLGAILAVVVYFLKRLWPFGQDKEKVVLAFSIWARTIVGVLPALILGFAFGNLIEEKLFNPWVVAAMLILGGIVLIWIEKKRVREVYFSVAGLPFLIVFFIGLIQCVSMVPGTSRAAATIIGALLLGASRTVAVEFSFFLAIPTMIAASGYSLLKHGAAMTGAEFVILIIGFSTAFVAALLAVKFFLNFIKNRNLKPFGYYRIILGVIVLTYFLLVR